VLPCAYRSALAPDIMMSSLNRAICAGTNSVTSCAVLPIGSAPRSASLSLTADVFSDEATSTFSQLMIAAGILAGASSVYHPAYS
jgi:hypothetical protein